MLFVGNDWAEDHHDVEIQDQAGRVLTRARLPEGVAGIAQFHALVAAHLPAVPAAGDPAVDGFDQAGAQVDVAQAQAAQEADAAGADAAGWVWIGIETDRGPWVAGLVAAGYRVFPVNPRQVARFRERHSNAGGKSDVQDAHTLADMVRTDGHQLRVMAGDTAQSRAVQVLARAHQTLVWEKVRHQARLRAGLRQYYPAALVAFGDLAAADALELLIKAPDPARGARLSKAQIGAALRRARRRDIDTKTAAIMAALRTPALALPEPIAAAFSVTTGVLAALIGAVNEQIAVLAGQLAAAFQTHPDAHIYVSQPGLAAVLGARVLGEFGDDPGRFADARARKNFAGTAPITRQSGKKKTVHARHVHNSRLIDALSMQALGALSGSPGARAYYDRQRARGVPHNPALRQVANRLVGILHGCLRHGTPYNETTAWPTPPTKTTAGTITETVSSSTARRDKRPATTSS